MWEAVLISQKPPDPSDRACAVIWLRWVWPFTQAINRGWVRKYDVTSSPRTRGFGSPPVPTNGFVMLVLVWWLNTMTARPVADSIVDFNHANWSGSMEPSAYPLGFTVSITTNRNRPWSKE